MTMQFSRRGFMQAGATAAGALALGRLMNSTAMAAIDPNSHPHRIFHASHYGPFEAVVRDGRITGISPVTELDQQPTDMLMLGVTDRIQDDTRILYPMVRKSYLDGWQSGDTRPELRGKEEFVQVDWDTALALAGHAILRTIEEHGNEAIFSSSYGGWANAGSFRPNVMQQRFFNLFGGCTITQGDFSAGASQVALPHIIGDMEVYSPQTAWEVVRDNTQVFVLVGCDPVKNNRIEFTVADHGMSRPWAEIRDAGCRFISINPQRTASDYYLNADWVRIIPNTDIALFLGMAHHVLDKGLEDRAYLDKYTTGADRWIAHVKGEDDGTPKTPDWASGITGIPAERIRELAELFAGSRTQFAGAWSLQRAHHGELTHHAIINFAALIGKHQLAWSVTQLGARCEFQFCTRLPTTGAEAEAAFHDALQMALHLYLINRGILITPFHNMTLCCPDTTAADVDRLLATLDQALTELLALPGAREESR